MTIQQFIEKAIEGGWKPFEKDERVHKRVGVEEDGWVVFTTSVNVRRRNLAEILLDPEAWKAVGKVEGWDGEPIVPHYKYPFGICEEAACDCPARTGNARWLPKMHDLIDHLAEGGTIESYLAGL